MCVMTFRNDLFSRVILKQPIPVDITKVSQLKNYQYHTQIDNSQNIKLFIPISYL